MNFKIFKIWHYNLSKSKNKLNKLKIIKKVTINKKIKNNN